MPQWFLDEPDSDEADAFYLAAFWELSTCRQWGFTPGPIPYDRIVDFAARARLDSLMTPVFCYVVRRLDGAYLKWSREEAERQREQKGRGAGGGA